MNGRDEKIQSIAVRSEAGNRRGLMAAWFRVGRGHTLVLWHTSLVPALAFGARPGGRDRIRVTKEDDEGGAYKRLLQSRTTSCHLARLLCLRSTGQHRSQESHWSPEQARSHTYTSPSKWLSLTEARTVILGLGRRRSIKRNTNIINDSNS